MKEMKKLKVGRGEKGRDVMWEEEVANWRGGEMGKGPNGKGAK
jgi:hypothetical protein